jgi:hypothetical protein
VFVRLTGTTTVAFAPVTVSVTTHVAV